MSGAGEDQQIGDAPIDPGAEPTQGQVPGISGKKENEQFAQAARRHELDVLKHQYGFLGKLWGGGTAATINIGGLVILLAFIFVGATLFAPPRPEVDKAREWAATIATAAVGYLFGALTSKRKD